MPLSTLEHDTVSKGCAVSKQLLLDLQPKLASLAQIYDSAGGVKTTVDQADLDAEAALSGLTKQQLDDAMYALTTVILPAIEQAYPALAQLSARFL